MDEREKTLRALYEAISISLRNGLIEEAQSMARDAVVLEKKPASFWK